MIYLGHGLRNFSFLCLDTKRYAFLVYLLKFLIRLFLVNGTKYLTFLKQCTVDRKARYTYCIYIKYTICKVSIISNSGIKFNILGKLDICPRDLAV